MCASSPPPQPLALALAASLHPALGLRPVPALPPLSSSADDTTPLATPFARLRSERALFLLLAEAPEVGWRADVVRRPGSLAKRERAKGLCGWSPVAPLSLFAFVAPYGIWAGVCLDVQPSFHRRFGPGSRWLRLVPSPNHCHGNILLASRAWTPVWKRASRRRCRQPWPCRCDMA
jgi:hypothetical protein